MTLLELLEPDQKQALYARACQLAKRYSKGYHDAGLDLLHDAYLKALQVQDKYRGRRESKSVGGWIYGMLGNIQMNRNTVEYGRKGRLGRRAMLAGHIREQAHLYRPGGRRAVNCKPKDSDEVRD